MVVVVERVGVGIRVHSGFDGNVPLETILTRHEIPKVDANTESRGVVEVWNDNENNNQPTHSCSIIIIIYLYIFEELIAELIYIL